MGSKALTFAEWYRFWMATTEEREKVKTKAAKKRERRRMAEREKARRAPRQEVLISVTPAIVGATYYIDHVPGDDPKARVTLMAKDVVWGEEVRFAVRLDLWDEGPIYVRGEFPPNKAEVRLVAPPPVGSIVGVGLRAPEKKEAPPKFDMKLEEDLKMAKYVKDLAKQEFGQSMFEKMEREQRAQAERAFQREQERQMRERQIVEKVGQYDGKDIPPYMTPRDPYGRFYKNPTDIFGRRVPG